MRNLIDLIETSAHGSPTPERFSEVLGQEIALYIDKTWCRTVEDINNGMCADFAGEVLKALGLPEFGSATNPFRNSTKRYWDFGDDLDLDMVRELGEPVPDDTPPSVTARELGSVHFWLTYNGRHYDAEAVQGVDHFLDLPFFQKIIRRLRAKP